jgi:hypothetical protein
MSVIKHANTQSSSIDPTLYTGSDSMALIESMIHGECQAFPFSLVFIVRRYLHVHTCQTELTLTQFDGDIAFALGQTIRENYEGMRTTTGILITIKLFSGLTLFQSACGAGVNPNNEDWVRRKFNTGE